MCFQEIGVPFLGRGKEGNLNSFMCPLTFLNVNLNRVRMAVGRTCRYAHELHFFSKGIPNISSKSEPETVYGQVLIRERVQKREVICGKQEYLEPMSSGLFLTEFKKTYIYSGTHLYYGKHSLGYSHIAVTKPISLKSWFRF